MFSFFLKFFILYLQVEEAAQAPEKANAQIPVSSHAQQLRPHVDEWQKPSPTRELDDTNIYVARLPREMTPDEFYKLIKKYGLVTSYRLLKGEDEDGKPVPRVGFAR
jgi:RNA recognition motif-containing protein